MNTGIMNWVDLTDISKLQNLHAETIGDNDHCLVIYKHSARCFTSISAKKMFESEWHSSADVYLVNVIPSRDVSDMIERLYGVQHESPQVLVIKNGKCVYHHSHHNIDAATALELCL